MAKRLRIIGLVQGVGYRASFERQALALRLCGWVRNRADGSVEALVGGSPESIEKILAWSRHGPSTAQVREVIVSDVDDREVSPGSFEVLPTA